MRPLVSYDDISLPHAKEADLSFGKPSPSKRRKRSSQKTFQHWDDLGCFDGAMNYDEDADVPSVDIALDEEADDEYQESRELTYDEIWDDSALINAWNAATDEYEAYHGGEKHWKKEAVTKSALWYNVPLSSRKKFKMQTQSINTAPKSDTHVDDTRNDADPQEGDSHPLNFDTFIPTHDPSLELPLPPHPSPVPGTHQSSQYSPHLVGPLLSKDEAFTRALGAMYWGGYWTAVYHCQSNRETETTMEDEDDGIDGESLMK